MTDMTQIAEHHQSERDKVAGWRLHVLMEAGYPLPLAERLAHSDADLHSAVELVRRRAASRRPPPRSCSRAASATSPPGWGAEFHPPPAVSVSLACARGCAEIGTISSDRATRPGAAPERAQPGRSIRGVKVEAIEYGDRRVYSVAAFNRGVGDWLARLPTVWVEGEVTELRRQDRWQSVFLTLKDPDRRRLPRA